MCRIFTECYYLIEHATHHSHCELLNSSNPDHYPPFTSEYSARTLSKSGHLHPKSKVRFSGLMTKTRGNELSHPWSKLEFNSDTALIREYYT